MNCELHKHPTKELDYIDGKVNIDEEIIDLISLLWKTGIFTVDCCQNDFPEDYISIQFKNMNDAGRFFDILWEFTYPNIAIDALHYRMVGGTATHPRRLKSWIWIPCPHYSLSVRFPKSDYELVLFIFQEGINEIKKKLKEVEALMIDSGFGR